MAGFIERSNSDSTQPMAVKTRTDATKALADADKHEEDLEKSVADWSTVNLKFLAGRKRKKSEPRNSVGQVDMRSSENKVWLASFEKTLMPKDPLNAGCEISEMKSFKKSMAYWIKFVKEHGNEINNTRYWHILANNLGPNMKTKLEAIEGIETAGEEKIWEYIEGIFQTSNPNYIRRQNCLTLKQKKGETTSEFSDRLKREFIESDLANATIWVVYQHKVIESLDTDNSDEKELKTKLLLKLKDKPNPVERDCDEFIREIREYEAVTNSRGHKEDKNNMIKKVNKEEDKKDEPPRAPHALSGGSA